MDPPHRKGVWIRNFRWGEWLSEPVSPLFATWFLPRTEPPFVAGSARTLGVRIPGPIHAVVNGWYFHSGSGLKSPLAFFPEMLFRRFAVMRAMITAPTDPTALERVLAEPERVLYEEDLLPRYRALGEQALPDETARADCLRRPRV